MRTVIFDLDGTLADTSRDLIAAANTCFQDLGLGNLLDPVDDAATAFRGGRAMLALGFSRVDGFGEDDIDRQQPLFVKAYDNNIDTHTTLYPYAMQAVETLKSNGFAVGICTNKPAGLAEKLLTRLGVRNEFASMIGADTLPVRKPDPAPFIAAVEQAGGTVSRSCLIGDTDTDRKTARAAGVPSVLVTFGPSGDTVRDLEPEALLHDYKDLPAIAVKLLV
ncbi:HAD-IA family hydrolase [Parasulfitobacter algicola]|uniref:phosphoglycolate phosphatase n=1 Tax=Parasulfitobacter algicola TaxID=2614809 RepID=A0ABX2INB0_9RHOB|nr:HAD-IA family hydrolase [Sulfitobacter algicola]NSX54377.1 HAD-IA family hydrolase [Sulfitobacter algicola]